MLKKFISSGVLLFMVFLNLSFPALASYEQQVKMSYPTSGSNDFWGWSSAIDGDWAAYSSHFNNFRQGKVIMYQKNGGSW